MSDVVPSSYATFLPLRSLIEAIGAAASAASAVFDWSSTRTIVSGVPAWARRIAVCVATFAPSIWPATSAALISSSVVKLLTFTSRPFCLNRPLLSATHHGP
jgi:hypothetical protein